jgi:hypothetical protein
MPRHTCVLLLIGASLVGGLAQPAAAAVCGLRLAFGNDDPLFSNPGDRAVLRVSNGPITVGKRSVVMNRNDVMDQSIGFTGASFTDAAFWYAVTTNGLSEVVDDIAVVPC